MVTRLEIIPQECSLAKVVYKKQYLSPFLIFNKAEDLNGIFT